MEEEAVSYTNYGNISSGARINITSFFRKRNGGNRNGTWFMVMSETYVWQIKNVYSNIIGAMVVLV